MLERSPVGCERERDKTNIHTCVHVFCRLLDPI